MPPHRPPQHLSVCISLAHEPALVCRLCGVFGTKPHPARAQSTTHSSHKASASYAPRLPSGVLRCTSELVHLSRARARLAASAECSAQNRTPSERSPTHIDSTKPALAPPRAIRLPLQDAPAPWCTSHEHEPVLDCSLCGVLGTELHPTRAQSTTHSSHIASARPAPPRPSAAPGRSPPAPAPSVHTAQEAAVSGAPRRRAPRLLTQIGTAAILVHSNPSQETGDPPRGRGEGASLAAWTYLLDRHAQYKKKKLT